MKDISEPTVISIVNYGVKTTVEYDHSDISLDEVFDAILGCLTTLTFHTESVLEGMIEYGKTKLDKEC